MLIRAVIKKMRDMKVLLGQWLSDLAPDYYQRRLLKKYPGLVLMSDPKSDVRKIDEQVRVAIREVLEDNGSILLQEIDDRSFAVFLVGCDARDHAVQLVRRLMLKGMRVAIQIKGSDKFEFLENARHLDRLGPKEVGQSITSIKAGFQWFYARHHQMIGWHAASSICIYDRKSSGSIYSARDPRDIPPFIDRSYSSPFGRDVAPISSDIRLDRIGFPIDVVYTWVDGDDPAWREKKEVKAGGAARKVEPRAHSHTRFKSRDELRFSLRSLHYYAPWVRNIFIVTDNQVPDWFDAGAYPNIRIVDHRELFPDTSVLPTFNSHAIESVLHRIPGLSENFLYMNDDVLFSSYIPPEYFFEASGIARTFLSRAMIPFCDPSKSGIASEWGSFNANNLLYQEHGWLMPCKTKHTPIPLKRDLLAELEARYPDQFDALRKRPFRTRDDIAPTSTLHAYFGLAEGKVVTGKIRYSYVDLSRPDLPTALMAIEKNRHAAVYCLNDTEVDDPKFDWDRQENIVAGFLQRMYPYQAPWEKY